MWPSPALPTWLAMGVMKVRRHLEANHLIADTAALTSLLMRVACPFLIIVIEYRQRAVVKLMRLAKFKLHRATLYK